jgi:regulatory protein
MATRRRFPKPGDERFADGSGADSDPSRIRSSAIALLARREHSTGELERKLESRGYDADVTAEVLADLGRKGLISDERYVTSFITHHAARGQGPMRIRSELRESGVAAELVERLLDESEVDWAETARNVRRKKFSTALPASFAERAKQSRFLQYRGFSQDQIRAAFGPGAGVDPEFASDPDLDI